jgi:phosphoesterase RecJ-like protein
MAYEIPAHRREGVWAVREALLASRRAVLTTHLNADGDGAGCEVALASWLRANGNEAYIVNPTPFPDHYRFLLEEGGDCVLGAGSPEAADACSRADLAIVLDTGEVSRIGRVKPLIEELATVVIDHHPLGDQPIGGVSLRDTTACATGELVFDVIHSMGGPWTRSVVEGLYVAVLTDTGSFRFSNSTPASHRVAAELIDRGADPEALHARVYGAWPLRKLHLLRAALETLELDADLGVAWMVIPDDAFQKLNVAAEDLEGLVDYPRSLEGVEVGLLFRKTSQGTKVSFRSNGAVDVNALARPFGGGGHVRASGALIDGDPAKVVPVVVAATRQAVLATRAAGNPEPPETYS